MLIFDAVVADLYQLIGAVLSTMLRRQLMPLYLWISDPSLASMADQPNPPARHEGANVGKTIINAFWNSTLMTRSRRQMTWLPASLAFVQKLKIGALKATSWAEDRQAYPGSVYQYDLEDVYVGPAVWKDVAPDSAPFHGRAVFLNRKYVKIT